MDCKKVGELILNIRKEKNMTQKQIADALNISDKAVSKWERGNGCPDVSLLGELSKVLEVNIEKILLGDLNPNDTDGGNMRQIKFYVCPECGNVINSTGDTDIACCGRRLVPLIAKSADEAHKLAVEEFEEAHKLAVEEFENDYYISLNHEMTKTHFISFAAYVSFDRMLLIKLYPEQNAELRFPKRQMGKLYYYCNQHGLWVSKI